MQAVQRERLPLRCAERAEMSDPSPYCAPVRSECPAGDASDRRDMERLAPVDVGSIDWLGRWLVEKGTNHFYLCNNGWHIFKTCGDSLTAERNARTLCDLLNERQRPNARGEPHGQPEKPQS